MATHAYFSKTEPDHLSEATGRLANGEDIISLSMHGRPGDARVAAVYRPSTRPPQHAVACDESALDSTLGVIATTGNYPVLIAGTGATKAHFRVGLVLAPSNPNAVVSKWQRFSAFLHDPDSSAAVNLPEGGEAYRYLRLGYACHGLIVTGGDSDPFVRALWIPRPNLDHALQWFETDRQSQLDEAILAMRRHRVRLRASVLFGLGDQPIRRAMLWEDPERDEQYAFGLRIDELTNRVGTFGEQGYSLRRVSSAGLPPAGAEPDSQIFDLTFIRSGSGRPARAFTKSPEPFFGLSNTNPFAPMDAYIETFMRARNIRAMQIGVAHHGKLKYARAYTWAEANFPDPDVLQKSRLGSITKSITATAIMMLLERNRIPGGLDAKVFDLLAHSDTPLRTFTGGLPTDGRFHALTVDHLLCMASTLSDHGGEQTDFDVAGLFAAATGSTAPVHRPITPAQSMSYIAQLDGAAFDQSWIQPWGQAARFTEPGDRVHYYNMCFVILARIIAALTHVPYIDWLDAHIFRPLGIPQGRVILTTGIPGTGGELPFHLARPLPVTDFAHSNPPPGEPQDVIYGGYLINPTAYDGNGALSMSIVDLIRFMASFSPGPGANAAPRLMRRATRDQMWTFPYFTQGVNAIPGGGADNRRGWYVDPIGTHLWTQHNGGTPGTESIAGIRDDGVALGVLLATDTLGDGFRAAQLDYVSSFLDPFVTANAWPVDDLFDRYGIGAW